MASGGLSMSLHRGVRGGLRPLATEMGLLAVLFTFYRWGRTLFDHGPAEAMANASRLWGFQGAWLPSEVELQQWALGWEHTAFLANVYYVGMHFPGTALLLVWLYVRHRSSYTRVRNELVVLTGAGLVVHVLFPLAPPRLAGIGATDTMLTVGPSAYPATTDGIANQYAAMPSLHVGWALLVAVAVLRVSRSRWRWVVAAHAPVTVFVVVVTANHYWTDGLVAAVLLAGALTAVAAVERVRRGAAPRAARQARATRPARAARPVPAAGDGPAGHVRGAGGRREDRLDADAPARDDLVAA
ncbi:phosphatase PAP2 family protein [Actinomadura sp. 6K520]|uniref:phosphatase PAP2 family protein n=1 Tax=Actinomadura sp. 6K520 TaxID=2530364 RepID=UPI001048F3BE|nr:phosphatase PAP2 family protein [Actinomadura sp. 6K520]TDE36922.1 inositol phosphorylceramide synthase [Actinomadura sp. 6K520]